MKILIQLPDLIEDAVMITPAIENIMKNNRNADITIIGSSITSQLFVKDVRINSVVVDESNRSMFRLLSLIRLARGLGQQDLVVSFKSNFISKFFLDRKSVV